jgi:hypothetical protein
VTWLIYYLIGAVVAAASVAFGYLCGLFKGRADIETRSYWQGFADGEYHAQMAERTPSPN